MTLKNIIFHTTINIGRLHFWRRLQYTKISVTSVNNHTPPMARDELLQIRINTQEKERLQLEAERRGVSMSEVIRDYIKRLPKSKKEA